MASGSRRGRGCGERRRRWCQAAARTGAGGRTAGAAQRAGQLRGPRQPSLAQPRRPAAHLAGELLAAQPPRRRRLHEAQFNLPGAGICHGHKQQVAATAAESGSRRRKRGGRWTRNDWTTEKGAGPWRPARARPLDLDFRSLAQAGLGEPKWVAGSTKGSEGI